MTDVTQTTTAAPVVADVDSSTPIENPQVAASPTADEINAAAVVAGVDPKDPVIAPTAEADGDRFVYEATGNIGLDVALDFIGNLGISGTDPAVQAAAKGDFTLLEAKLAVMGDKARGYEKMLKLGKDAVANHAAESTAATEKSVAAIYQVTGGQDNWAAIRDFAGEKASAEEKKELNTLLQSGPLGARAAANLMLQAYQKAKGTTINPRNPAAQAGAQVAAQTNGPLNGKEYAQAVRELRTKLGYKMETSQEYTALRSRYRA
jgi:hypothetical protein